MAKIKKIKTDSKAFSQGYRYEFVWDDGSKTQYKDRSSVDEVAKSERRRYKRILSEIDELKRKSKNEKRRIKLGLNKLGYYG